MHCAQDLRKSQLPKHRPSRRGFGSCVFRRRLAHSAQRTRDARPYGCCVRRGPAANPACGPGGHQGRPYGHDGNVNRVRRGGLYALLCPATGTTGGRNKSHPGQGGSMWASTPTGAGGSFRRVCRGGLYIRPVAAGSWSFLVAAWAGAYIMRPYGYDGSDPLRHGFAMPPPLGHQGEAIFRFRGGG